MSGFEQMLVLLQGATVWTVVKWLMVVGLILYNVFAVVVMRQVSLMSRTVNGILELPLKLLSWVHLGLSLVALVVAIVIL